MSFLGGLDQLFHLCMEESELEAGAQGAKPTNEIIGLHVAPVLDIKVIKERLTGILQLVGLVGELPCRGDRYESVALLCSKLREVLQFAHVDSSINVELGEHLSDYRQGLFLGRLLAQGFNDWVVWCLAH